MPDLPLDSDKSEEGEGKNQISNDDIPELLMQNSGVIGEKKENKVEDEDFPETLNQDSIDQINKSPEKNSNEEGSKIPDRANSIVAIDLQNPGGGIVNGDNTNVTEPSKVDSPFSKTLKKQKQGEGDFELKV